MGLDFDGKKVGRLIKRIIILTMVAIIAYMAWAKIGVGVLSDARNDLDRIQNQVNSRDINVDDVDVSKRP